MEDNVVTMFVRYCACTNMSIEYRECVSSCSTFFSKFKLYVLKELNFLFIKMMFSIYDSTDNFLIYLPIWRRTAIV